jgi:hypothetical protein
MSRDLFIVSRRDPELYEYLKGTYLGDQETEVILDRRVGERRQQPSPAHRPERRVTDRRSRPHVSADLESLGFAVVRLPRETDHDERTASSVRHSV